MARRTIGIIVHGATGRIGSTQHLANALIPIIEEGGLAHGDDRLVPRLLLTGRDAARLAAVAKGGELGRIVGFRLEFGWWVFDGSEQPCQRPSWNYRAGGGGIILDMYPHWRYVIESIVGRIVRVASSAWIATPERVDERGERYGVAVEDSAATLVEVEGGAFGTIVSSWATRVRADDRSGWIEAPPLAAYCNPYRVGWEAFLRHVAADAPLESDFAAGIRDVAFADACHRSMRERTWIALPPAEQIR